MITTLLQGRRLTAYRKEENMSEFLNIEVDAKGLTLISMVLSAFIYNPLPVLDNVGDDINQKEIVQKAEQLQERLHELGTKHNIATY